MKLLWVFSTFAIGGPQRRFAALAPALGREFSHAIVAMDGRTDAAQFLTPSADWRLLPVEVKKSSFVSWSSVRRFRRMIAEQKPDILLTSNWGTIEWAIANRGRGRRPHIHFEDGFGPDEQLRQNPRRIIARATLLRNSLIVVPSRTLYNVALSLWRLPDRNVALIANGVDLARFAPAARTGPDIVVGSLGALRAEKNYRRLVRAFAAAKTASGPMRLAIFGEGPDRVAIEAEARAAGVADRIILPGAALAPERALASIDIFALSSDTEQAPLSLMEAMVSGLPVVATDVGDIADMVSDENRPFIVSAADETAFAEKLTRLAGDRDLRLGIGAANAAKASRDFSLDRMVAAHLALYRRALGRSVP